MNYFFAAWNYQEYNNYW